MKKVLIITLEFPPQVGGIATYVKDLAGALPADRVVVLAPTENGAKTWDATQSYHIIRRTLLYPVFLWPRWLRMFWQVRAIVKQEKIELIMIHHVLPVGYIGVLMKRLCHVPFLLFSQGTDLVAGTATPWKKRMVEMVSRHAEQIIFNSESLKRRYLEKMPVFAGKSIVMYPCPEPDFFIRPDQELLQTLRRKYALLGKKVVVSAARLVDGKGFPHLIRILPLVLQEEPNLVWFIIGDGPKRDYLMKHIQAANLQNVVRFVGEISHAEIKPFLYLADLFVLLTHPDEGKEEGLGLVFLEAAAAGVPVVAGRSGGVEEAVADGVTGRVMDVNLGDQQIATVVLELLKDTTQAKQLGTAGQNRMRHEFVWDIQLQALASWLV